MSKVCICVAWPYSNGPIHLGHLAGSLLLPDIFSRYNRLIGNEVLMVGGSDQHGTPITVSAEKGSRSGMNVTFRTGDEALDAKFVAEAAQAGFVNLKGHRKVGGMRASIYNAMPVEGVEKLCDFIRAFDKAN